jgi:hypothetical protein
MVSIRSAATPRARSRSPYAAGITPWLFSNSWLLSLARPLTVARSGARVGRQVSRPPGGSGDDDGLALLGPDGVYRPHALAARESAGPGVGLLDDPGEVAALP